MRLVFDLEGDNLRLQITKLWCAVFKDVDTGDKYSYDCRSPTFQQEVVDIINKATLLIGHNIINYDLPVLNKLFNIKYTGEIWDTLVVSRVTFPDRPGGHSLEAWGERFKRHKPEHEDWSQFSEEMLHRCSEDVEINYLLYQYQVKGLAKSNTDWTNALKLEHKVAQIMTLQEINGVQFDIDKAKSHVSTLTNKMDNLYSKIRPHLRYDVILPYGDRPVNKVFNKDRSYTKYVQGWYEDCSVIWGPFTRVLFEEPDIGSRKKLIKQLLSFGWQPDIFTEPTDGNPRGSPKLTIKGQPVESLMRIKGDIGKEIALWYTLSHRRSQIQGWIDNPRLQMDGRLSAEANSCGTNTARMKHRTVVNVPKADKNVIFGHEMRELFIAKPGYKFVGHDASGLENRMLAHYMNDPDLTHEILEGDFHTKVWSTIQEYIHSRNNTKNVEYALFYGASDKKLGSMADYKPKGMSDTELGGIIRALIMKGLPALDDLTKRIQAEAKKGYVIGLDGRKLHVRSSHSALNVKLQGAGAIVMKTAMVFLDKWVRKYELDVTKVIDMHDEQQAEVLPKHVELYSKLAIKSIETAGTYYKLNVPLTGEVKVGNNWAETH